VWWDCLGDMTVSEHVMSWRHSPAVFRCRGNVWRHAVLYTGCEYGDRASWCKTYTLQQCKQDSSVQATCCFTCNGTNTQIDTSSSLVSLLVRLYSHFSAACSYKSHPLMNCFNISFSILLTNTCWITSLISSIYFMTYFCLLSLNTVSGLR